MKAARDRSGVGAEQMMGQKDNELEVAKRDADIARTLAAGRADAVCIEAQGVMPTR